MDNKFVVGSAITKVTGTWVLYTLCKSYAVDTEGNIVNTERVSISDPIIATVSENNIDIGAIEKTEIDPNIKIIYDELISFKKELESNEATRQVNEVARVNAENGRLSAETDRVREEQARKANEAQRAENEAINAWLKNNDLMFVYILKTPTEEDLTAEQVQKLKALKTYYPTTNITTNSEQLEGYTVFNYPISMSNDWNYVKQQLNDNRDYIYDIDMQSSEAYVNSKYVTALTDDLKNKIDIFFLRQEGLLKSSITN